MRRNEVLGAYKSDCKKMGLLYNWLCGDGDKESALELARMRGYVGGGEQERMCVERGLYKAEKGIEEIVEGTGLSQNELFELGCVNRRGGFVLEGRYLIPVRDIAGNVVTVIGYYPGERKYITVGARFFSKESMLFNLDEAYRRGGVVYLVEGIFDCLSISALGLSAVSTMGSTVSAVKCELLKLFERVVYIPDNDAAGWKGLEKWQVPRGSVGVRLRGSMDLNTVGEGEDGYDKEKVIKIKDMDDLIRFYEGDSVRELLTEAAQSTRKYETVAV